jgi:hypothetical protein
MINLDEQSLLEQYREAKDTEIERLLSQYGSSLKEVREMYPQLTGTIKQRQLTTVFPTQPLFFTPSEAAQMNLQLQEGWMLKMTPTEGNGGYTSSLITPEKWEITEDDFYISPTGEKYSRADMQALLSEPTGGLTSEELPFIPTSLTIEDLTEEGRRLYQEYQTAGGTLDVAGWARLREQEQLETEEVFGKVFPGQDINEVIDYMNTNPQGFLADIREIGPTEDMIALLKSLEFKDEAGNITHYTDEEIQEVFETTPVPEYIPESRVKDAWDAFIAGGMGFIQGIETFLFTNPPGRLTPEQLTTWATHTTALAPEFLQSEMGQQWAEEQYQQGLQNTIDGYLRRRAEQQTFWISHPELTPKPEYLVSPWDNPALLKDPGYWAYSISSSLAYTFAIMGTIIGVSAVATPFVGVPAGLALAGMPEAGNMIDQLVDKGVPIGEATEWAKLYGLAAGGIEGASDLPFIGLVFQPFKAVIKPMWNTIFKGVASQLAKRILTGVVITQGEALEEVFTQVIQNAILKHYDETQSLLEGVSQAYIQAAIASTPFGAIGGYASFSTFRSNLSTETGQKYDESVKKFQDAGLTEGQAQVQAANELAMTPEGEGELSKAIEVAQEEYWEEHPELTRPSMEPVISTELADQLLNEMKIAQEVAKKVTPVTPEVTEIKIGGEVSTAIPEWQMVEDRSGIGKQTRASRSDIEKVIDAIPDVDDPDVINYWQSIGDEEVYLEGWSDKCLAGTGFPKMEAGGTSEKVDYIRDLTRDILERKGREKGLTLIEGGFIELDEAENLYGITYGVYRKIPTAEAGMPEVKIGIGDEVVVRDSYTHEVSVSGKVTKIIEGEQANIFRGKPVIQNYYEIGGKGLYGEGIVEKVTIRKAEAGMPEAGLQPSMLEEVPAKEVKPAPSGKLVQARLDDYLRLREYNSKAVADRISEIKKQLETKGRLKEGTKGDLRLELARLEAQQELDAVKSIEDLDALIRDVETELGLRSMPYAGYGGKSHIDLIRHPTHRLFKGYTSRQLEEMLNVYQQARTMMQPEVALVKAEEIPLYSDPWITSQLTNRQIDATLDIFKQALVARTAAEQRVATIELRKHVLAQRAMHAADRVKELIAEDIEPSEAIKMANQEFLSGKLPEITTDFYNDLTIEMVRVLEAKVYNYWIGKDYFELTSTMTALTNALRGESIPRKPGTGTKYFPQGGSAWDRLAKVFADQPEILGALDKGVPLQTTITGVILEPGRGDIALTQETIDYLRGLATLTPEQRILLEKPLSELTENDVRQIALQEFYRRQAELNILLAEGTITKEQYKLELLIAKDKTFPYRDMGPFIKYPPTTILGQPRLGERGYTPPTLEETRTAEELRLRRFELWSKLPKEPREISIEPAINEAFKQLPLLTFREKQTIVRILKEAGLVAVDIGNFLRANKASFDMSFWRQVKTLAIANPVEFYRSNVEAFKALFSQKSAEANWEWVKRQPSYPYYANMVARTGQDFLRMLQAPKGTAQWQAAEEFGYLTEERLIPRFTARIPWVKWSGRAFVVGTNTITILTYNKCLEATLRLNDAIATGQIKLKEGEAFSIQQEMDDYGKAIAWMTQRASLGKAKALAPEINAMFFAARSKLGRFLTPKLLIDSNPRVRAFAWKNLSLFVGAMGGLVMLGLWLGLWDAEDEPRNAEFLSIRIGNLRIDPWAGYRQFLVLYTRLITGTGISSVTGQEYEVNPIGALWSFLRGSLAPLSSEILNFWTGKNFLGEEVSIENARQWLERISPFSVWDIWEAFEDDWVHGVIAILPSIFGEGVQTYTGDWGENWRKLGLPKYLENTGYGIYEPIYDLADFWADTASQFRGVDPSTLTESKGFPEYVRSIAEALQVIEQIETLPNKRLISLNANPEEGTTFVQYYQMWQERQKIVASGDKEALKAFDADERTRNAYLGNITQAQYALLVEYNSLPESQKAEFLGRHPELYINPREEWLRTHPEENALLALWGKADVYSIEAFNKVSILAKSLDIPENALVMKDLDPVTELKLKNQHLFALLEAYGGLEDTLKGPDGLTARDRAIQQLYLDNPNFRDDQRRIEALNVGTKDNPTLDTMIEGWVERGQVADEFGASSAEMKLWLVDNKEVHQWALESGLLTDDGSDWNEDILRLQVNYKEDFDKYANYGDITSPLYISNDTARADAREAMLFSNDKMTSFGVAYYTIGALEKGIPENFVTTYIDYYRLSAAGYGQERFLMEHKDYYKDVWLGILGNAPKDFSGIPTQEEEKLLNYYDSLDTGSPRLQARCKDAELDAALVKIRGLEPAYGTSRCG